MSQQGPCTCRAYMDGSIDYCLTHAKAPEMYVVVKRAVCDAHHIYGDGKQPCSVPRGRCSELCKRARALLQEIEGEK